MIKSIKEEIEKYLKDNPVLEKEINNRKIEKEIFKIIPPKILNGIKEIKISQQTLKIITKSPSWRQETLFFKKEIIKIIIKKLPNYNIKNITIL